MVTIGTRPFTSFRVTDLFCHSEPFANAQGELREESRGSAVRDTGGHPSLRSRAGSGPPLHGYDLASLDGKGNPSSARSRKHSSTSRAMISGVSSGSGRASSARTSRHRRIASRMLARASRGSRYVASLGSRGQATTGRSWQASTCWTIGLLRHITGVCHEWGLPRSGCPLRRQQSVGRPLCA